MKSLLVHLDDYLNARRALGTQLKEPGRTLRQFVELLREHNARFISVELALKWAKQSANVQRATWARKLSMVRQFARWMNALDPRHQVPPKRLLNVRHRRNKPHIYTEKEIHQLMATTAEVKPFEEMTRLNLRTLIGLLAATGLRPGEASALEIGDVDLKGRVLIIRDSKFGKSRHVPIHPSTVEKLKSYARRRDKLVPIPGAPTFFVGSRGAAMDLGTIRKAFKQVCIDCGLRRPADGNRSPREPRLQDFRHSFATKRIIEWYRRGRDVALEMPKLATYLGHASVGCTYWYLEAVPELLEMAAALRLKVNRGGRR